MHAEQRKMQRSHVLKTLQAHQGALRSFQVKSLLLFGSVGQDEATVTSDVDLLVEFDKPVGLLTFVRLQRYLETLVACPIDLGTPDSLKPDLRVPVLREAMPAF